MFYSFVFTATVTCTNTHSHALYLQLMDIPRPSLYFSISISPDAQYLQCVQHLHNYVCDYMLANCPWPASDLSRISRTLRLTPRKPTSSKMLQGYFSLRFWPTWGNHTEVLQNRCFVSCFAWEGESWNSGSMKISPQLFWRGLNRKEFIDRLGIVRKSTLDL